MKTDRPTCALCAAYDAPLGECHRHPVKPWPKMESGEWCADWMPAKTESGWRVDWPDRDGLKELLQVSPDGLEIEAIGSALAFPDLSRLQAALAQLRAQGHAARSGAKWHPITPPRAPKKTEAPARTESPRYTEQEFLAQFPIGERAALPHATIQKKAMANLGISPGKFTDERFNLLVAGLLAKTKTPAGLDLYYRKP